MDFGEVRGLEEYFGKYLTYEGFNLWRFIDVALYYKFLANDCGPTFYEKTYAKLIPFLFRFQQIKRKDFSNLSKQKCDTLFFPFAATHVNTFERVMERLKSSKVIIKDSLVNNNVRVAAKKLNIPFEGIENYFDKKIVTDLKEAQKWVKNSWKDILNDSKIQILFEKKPFLRCALKYFLLDRKRIVEIIGYVKLVEKIFSEENPKLVIVADEHTDFGSVVVTLAKKFGIPSLNMQHGSIINNDVVTSELKATSTAVFSPRDKEFLVKNGLDSKRIEVTGQPRYDTLSNAKIDRVEECRKLGLDPNKKICLFATQYSLNEKDLLLINHVRGVVFETLENRKDLQLVVKTHPSDDQDYSSEVSDNVKIISDFSLNKTLLNLCDVLMVTSSTIALEGIICGKPLIIVNNGGNIYYLDEGVALKATNKEELGLTLNKVFNDAKVINSLKNKRKTFIYNYAYKLDGKSTERVLRLINRLLK